MMLLRTAVGLYVHIQHCCLWCVTVLLMQFTARVRGSSAVCQAFPPNLLQKAFCYFSLLAGPTVISAFRELYKEAFGRSYCSLFSFFSAMKHILSPLGCWDVHV